MKTLQKILFLALVTVGFAGIMLGQPTLTTTTLSGAISASRSGAIQQIAVTSGTGIIGQSNNTPATGLYIDHEYMVVISITPQNTSSRAIVQVQRGNSGTAALAHQNGALVFIGQTQLFNGKPIGIVEAGPCTASTTNSVPIIHVIDRTFWTCSAEGIFGYAGPSMSHPSAPNSRTVVTATYTALYWDQIIEASSGTFVITLPAAAAMPGKVFLLTNPGSGTLTITTATGCATIANTAACRVYSTGAAWQAF